MFTNECYTKSVENTCKTLNKHKSGSLLFFTSVSSRLYSGFGNNFSLTNLIASFQNKNIS